jgi:ubiquinone/menaquinone biosynthesis C-methylase UbiE
MNPNYWDDIYRENSEKEVSWFQAIPQKSLELISELGLLPDDRIIDVGGGDSHLVDHLLSKGFTNISVLDISAAALDKAKARLAERSKFVKFIASDITKFKPQETYMLWHDRATFHFLTKLEDVDMYLEIANRAIAPGGYLIVSTFSKTGPDKCSGLLISRYSDGDLKMLFKKYFTNIRCFEDKHKTPWGSSQNFVYCGFKKKS